MRLAFAPVSALGLAIGSMVSCASASPPLDLPEDPWASTQARCSVARSRDNPLVVEWPAPERGSLEMRLRKGAVVVRYAGCEMQVLKHCYVPDSAYEYGAFTRKRETVRIRDADELYAKLPVGAARLEGKLADSEALEVSMTMVGMFESTRPSAARGELVGDCDGATHVVAGVQVGAYAFEAERSLEASGAVGLRSGPSVGGRHERERETLSMDGRVEACATSTPGDTEPPADCGALLRVEVVPLDADPALTQALPEPSRCPPGFVDYGADCEREPECPPDYSCAGNGGRCPSGMSWIPASSQTAGFCLDDTEATVWAYDRCVEDGACADASTTVAWARIDPDEQDLASELCNAGRPDRADHPINCVTWAQARAYCQWRGTRLPGELEWRWAASGGGQERVYPWGDLPPTAERVNACGEECRVWFQRRGRRRPRVAFQAQDGHAGTAPAGSFPNGASRWGPLQLGGNVAEWTADWADDDQDHRRIVGGSFWVQRAAWLRNDDTAKARPDRRDAVIGFRCARAPQSAGSSRPVPAF